MLYCQATAEVLPRQVVGAPAVEAGHGMVSNELLVCTNTLGACPAATLFSVMVQL